MQPRKLTAPGGPWTGNSQVEVGSCRCMVTTTAATDRAIRRDIAHLARRAGFGLHADEIDALAAGGYEAAVDELVGSLTQQDAAADAVPLRRSTPPRTSPARRSNDPAQRREARDRLRADRRALIGWVVQRMVGAQLPAREKLTFLWHDFFATSAEKVRITELLYGQYRMLYAVSDPDASTTSCRPWRAIPRRSSGSTVARTPPRHRTRTSPASCSSCSRSATVSTTTRAAGSPSRTPKPTWPKPRARSPAGTISAEGAGVLVPRRHDRGTKTVLGRTGALVLDEIVDIAVNGDTCAPHVVARLWSRMGRPADAEDDVVQELAAGFAADRDVQRSCAACSCTSVPRRRYPRPLGEDAGRVRGRHLARRFGSRRSRLPSRR